ncbi:hypothetical protein O6H91_17G087900 [Diphasiastrum complanatum]|uniref:Uncharacterized protein n=1 Tax=Diphasiastrum complanatum TaxID=34168 RepID=A0ACC2B8Y9_DIPCM|nr:hypothetical protein O6H91_17G087900 [Diphasiastrum complanatum]
MAAANATVANTTSPKWWISILLNALLFLTLSLISSASAQTTFMVRNRCRFTIWVGTQPGAGQAILENGGFVLTRGQSYSMSAPVGWSGRFWGRTDCKFDSTGHGSCATGDCGGSLQCKGAGGNPPATLVEITLGKLDYYDVSLVDGFNVPVSICPSGGSGNCGSPSCTNNVNRLCPSALRVQNNGKVVGCKSACLAFGSPEFCCTGSYGSADRCTPSTYAQMFKTACPSAYSYAFDDRTSIYTCSGARSYTVSFCH